MEKSKKIFIAIFISIIIYGIYNFYENYKQSKAQKEFSQRLEIDRDYVSRQFEKYKADSITFPEGYIERWQKDYMESCKKLLIEEYKKEGIIIKEE